jgi:hypothetical protein
MARKKLPTAPVVTPTLLPPSDKPIKASQHRAIQAARAVSASTPPPPPVVQAPASVEPAAPKAAAPAPAPKPAARKRQARVQKPKPAARPAARHPVTLTAADLFANFAAMRSLYETDAVLRERIDAALDDDGTRAERERWAAALGLAATDSESILAALASRFGATTGKKRGR